MLHSASGFRGVRAGAARGVSPRHEPLNGAAVRQPRIRVSYWCLKGHETALVFAQLPEDQIPGVWDCRRCGAGANRGETHPGPEDALGEGAPAEGYKSHLDYLKERRSSQDAEDALDGALERLRARRSLPDELLRDP